MKLFFGKHDSLYKIFKAIEKVSGSKMITIFIDSKNSFFENLWRGAQIKELLEKKHISYEFIAKNEQAKNYFKRVGLAHQYVYGNPVSAFFSLLYQFFFKAKHFHLYIVAKKNYLFYLVFFLESIAVLYILYLLYSFILPGAVISIKPAYTVEDVVYNFRYYPASETQYANSQYISIPYHTGSIGYKYSLSVNSQNVSTTLTPAQGGVVFVNKTNQPYSLVKGTRLVTDDGLVFRTNNRVSVPAATAEGEGKAEVNITAADYDENDTTIGDRGNILRGTKLYVRNLTVSYFAKEFYALTSTDFVGGKTEIKGSIDETTIQNLKDKLTSYIYANKKLILREKFPFDGPVLLINFDDYIKTSIMSVDVNGKVGDQMPRLSGSIEVSYNYMYVNRTDVYKAVNTYLAQRPSESIDLIEVNKNSFTQYSITKTDSTGVFIIPTKVGAIWGYNFKKDINGVANEMKDKISGLPKEEAQKIIMTYPDVGAAIIKVTPYRYSVLPRLKSRISIEVQ